MPEPEPVALVGDLLATQAKARGVAALLVDAAVRDVEELRELGLPIWARWVRVRGADKRRRRDRRAGEVGGATIRPGDTVVLDADGAVVVRRERVEEVLAASHEREERERVKRAKLQGGALSYDLDGLRARVEGEASRSRDLAHIGHAELLTPRPRRACASSSEVLGMEVEARDGPVGVPARLGRLPALQPQAHRVATGRASGTWRCAPGARRRSSAASPRSRRPGSGRAGSTATSATGRAYRFTDPDGHVMELLLRDREVRAARAPAARR